MSSERNKIVSPVVVAGEAKVSATQKISLGDNLTPLVRSERVRRYLEKAAEQFARMEWGGRFKVTHENQIELNGSQVTFRLLDKLYPGAISPYVIFRILGSQSFANLEVDTMEQRQVVNLIDDREYETVKAVVDSALTRFVEDSRYIVIQRKKATSAREGLDEDMVSIAVDTQLDLTDVEARQLRQVLGGVVGTSMEDAPPIVLEHDLGLDEGAAPNPDGKWREGDLRKGKGEAATRILAKRSQTLIAERYVLRKLLGTGGMRAVFIAEDLKEKQTRAIKILHSTLATDRTVVQRFFREVDLLSRIQHPNVIGIFDSGTFENVIYYTMEYVRGLPLNKLVPMGKQLKSEALLNFALQLAHGVEAIHRIEVVHRDLKGENVLVTEDKKIKIIDFGIARTTDSSLTNMGEVIGSPAYLSPELWRGEQPSFASDVYALGVIFYRITFGCLPFLGENPVAVMNKHLHEQPEFSSSGNIAAPKWFVELTRNMLAKNQKTRPSIKDVIEILQAK